MASQGLVDDGGGEKRGIVGIVVGMVGSEGIVVGKGGSVTLGILGIVGKVGFGTDGICELGKGGSAVGFGRGGGAVGSVGRGVLGRGGNVTLGSVGTAGNGGNVALGRGGIGIVGSGGVIGAA